MKKENEARALFVCLPEERQDLMLAIMEAFLPKPEQGVLQAYRAADKDTQEIVRAILRRSSH